MADFNALKIRAFITWIAWKRCGHSRTTTSSWPWLTRPTGTARAATAGRFGGMFAASIDGTATRRHRNAGTTASEVLLTSTSEQTQNKPHYNRFGGRLDRYKRQERTTPAQPTSPWNAGADNGQPSTETT